jgi:hypothetical protein
MPLNWKSLNVSRVRRNVAAWTAVLAVVPALVAQVVMPVSLMRGPIALAMICTAQGAKSAEPAQSPSAPGDNPVPGGPHCPLCTSAAVLLAPVPTAPAIAIAERGLTTLAGDVEARPSNRDRLHLLRPRAPPPGRLTIP